MFSPPAYLSGDVSSFVKSVSGSANVAAPMPSKKRGGSAAGSAGKARRAASALPTSPLQMPPAGALHGRGPATLEAVTLPPPPPPPPLPETAGGRAGTSPRQRFGGEVGSPTTAAASVAILEAVYEEALAAATAPTASVFTRSAAALVPPASSAPAMPPPQQHAYGSYATGGPSMTPVALGNAGGRALPARSASSFPSPPSRYGGGEAGRAASPSAGPAKPAPLPARGGASGSPPGAAGLRRRSTSPPHEPGLSRGLPQGHYSSSPGQGSRAAPRAAAAPAAAVQPAWRSPSARPSPPPKQTASSSNSRAASAIPHYARPLGRFDDSMTGGSDGEAEEGAAAPAAPAPAPAPVATKAKTKKTAAAGSGRPSGVAAALAIKSPLTAGAGSSGSRPGVVVEEGRHHLPHSALSPLYGKEHAKLPLYGGPEADTGRGSTRARGGAMLVSFKRVDEGSLPSGPGFGPSLAVPSMPTAPTLPGAKQFGGGRSVSPASGRPAAPRGMASPSPVSGGVPDTTPPALGGAGGGAVPGAAYYHHQLMPAASPPPPPRQPLRGPQSMASPSGSVPLGAGTPGIPASAPALGGGSAAPELQSSPAASTAAPAPPSSLLPHPLSGPSLAFTSPLGATIVNPQVLAAAVADLQAQLSHTGAGRVGRSSSPLERHEFGAVAAGAAAKAIPTVSLLRVAGLAGGAGAAGAPEAGAGAATAPVTPFSATAVSSYLSRRSPAGGDSLGALPLQASSAATAAASGPASIGDLHDAATRLVAGLSEDMQEQLSNLAPFGKFLVDQARAGIAAGTLAPGVTPAGGPTDIAQLVEVLKALAVVHHGEALGAAAAPVPAAPASPAPPSSATAPVLSPEAVAARHILVSAHAAEHGRHYTPPPPQPPAPVSPAPHPAASNVSTASPAASFYGFGTPAAVEGTRSKPPSPTQPPPASLMAAAAASSAHASAPAASPFAPASTMSTAALAPLRAFKEGLSAAAAASPLAALRGVVSGTNVDAVPLATIMQPGEAVGALLGDLHEHVAAVNGSPASASSTPRPASAKLRTAENARASMVGAGRLSASTPSFKAAAAALGLPSRPSSPSQSASPAPASPPAQPPSPPSPSTAATLASAAAARLSIDAGARVSASLSPQGVAAPAPVPAPASAAPYYSLLAAVDAGGSAPASSSSGSFFMPTATPQPPSRAGAATPSMESPTGPIAGHLARLTELIHKTSGGAAPLYMEVPQETTTSAASYLGNSSSVPVSASTSALLSSAASLASPAAPTSAAAPPAPKLALDSDILAASGLVPTNITETLAALRSSIGAASSPSARASSLLAASPAAVAAMPHVAPATLGSSTSGVQAVLPPKSALAAAVATSSPAGVMPLPPGPAVPQLAPASPAAAARVASVADVRAAMSTAFRDIAAEIMADSEALMSDVRSEVVDILAQGAEMETLVAESRTAYEGARGAPQQTKALSPGGAQLSSTLYSGFGSAASTAGGLATASPVGTLGPFSALVSSSKAPTSTSALLSQLRGGGGLPSFE